jgi:hypothetical protein
LIAGHGGLLVLLLAGGIIIITLLARISHDTLPWDGQ